MANSPANIQAAAPIPAMMQRSGGRHRKKRTGKVVLSHQSERSHVAEPKAFPPHAPLLSGGWYRQPSPSERPGPGHYPLEDHADRSVGAALALGLLGGPIGLCYTSVLGGLSCLALMGIGLLLIGFAALPAGWALAIAWAGISASHRHRRHQRL